MLKKTKVTLTHPPEAAILNAMHHSNGRTAAALPTSNAVADAGRRDKRINVAVPVKVFLAAGSPDGQICCTFEISLTGARLMAASGVNEVGQFVWLQRLSKRARYKVTWIGEPGTAHANQFGVETMEPTNVIWENELKMRIMRSK